MKKKNEIQEKKREKKESVFFPTAHLFDILHQSGMSRERGSHTNQKKKSRVHHQQQPCVAHYHFFLSRPVKNGKEITRMKEKKQKNKQNK